MSFSDDPKKELEALQAQLEAQEDWFQRELDSAKRMIGENPVPRTPVASVAAVPVRSQPAQYKTAPQPAPIPEITPEEKPKKKKGVKGLLILAGLELLGIGGIVAYWLLFLL